MIKIIKKIIDNKKNELNGKLSNLKYEILIFLMPIGNSK